MEFDEFMDVDDFIQNPPMLGATRENEGKGQSQGQEQGASVAEWVPLELWLAIANFLSSNPQDVAALSNASKLLARGRLSRNSPDVGVRVDIPVRARDMQDAWQYGYAAIVGPADWFSSHHFEKCKRLHVSGNLRAWNRRTISRSRSSQGLEFGSRHEFELNAMTDSMDVLDFGAVEWVEFVGIEAVLLLRRLNLPRVTKLTSWSISFLSPDMLSFVRSRYSSLLSSMFPNLKNATLLTAELIDENLAAQLTTLEIELRGGSDIETFNMFTFPNLQELHVIPTWSKPTVLDSAKFPKLQSFTRSRQPRGSGVKFVGQFDQLTSLRFGYGQPTPPYQGAGVRPPAKTTLQGLSNLPRLQRIVARDSVILFNSYEISESLESILLIGDARIHDTVHMTLFIVSRVHTRM